jgi:hypothetical protein
MFHPLIRLPSISARLSPRASGERMRLRLPSADMRLPYLDLGVFVYCVNVIFTMLALIWGVVEGM